MRLLFICIVVCLAVASSAQESTLRPVNRAYTVRFLANGVIEAPFKVDTRGTTTAGIQEAINAWTNNAVGSNGPLASTLNLQFAGVSFFYSNPIVANITYESGVRIEGDGCQNSMLVFAGTNTGIECFRIQSASTNGSLLQGYSLFVRDIGFSCVTNTTNILLHVAAASHAEFDHVNFTAWDIRAEVGSTSASSTLTPVTDFLNKPERGLVGLVLDGAQGFDQGNEIHDCFFAGLATGIFTDVDHVESHGLLGILIGVTGDVLFGVGNQWPASSYYSLGAMVVAKGGKERKWYGTHCYAANVGFAALAATTADLLDHPSFETCYNGVISDATNLLAACCPIIRNPEINEFGTPAANTAFWDVHWMTNGAATYGVSNAVCPGSIVESFVTPKFALGATRMNYGSWRVGGTNCLTLNTNLNVEMLGVVNAGNSLAGIVGEYTNRTLAAASPQALLTTAPTNITAVTLAAGDWDVEGNVNFSGTGVTNLVGFLSTTGNALTVDGTEIYLMNGVASAIGSITNTVVLPRKRINVSSSTTVFLIGKATFGAGTASAFGTISARRTR